MRKTLLLLLSFLFASSGAGAAEVEVRTRKIEDRKAVIATVETLRQVPARARIGGTINLLTVKEGDRVAAGEKIALIGDAKLAIRGQGMESRFLAAQSALDKAKIDFERARDLRQSGYGTQARLDEAKTALQVAEHNLEAAKSEQREVVQQSSEGAVLAPSGGRVLRVPVSIGSVVMAGETVAVLAEENYVLRLELPERHARFLKVGDKVLVGSRGLQAEEGETLKEGKVRLVYPEITNGRVRADVVVPDLGDYFVGERTRVYLTTGERDARMVPKAGIVTRAGVDFVKLKNGSEIAVQVGQTLGDEVEILAGLRDGDIVVTP